MEPQVKRMRTVVAELKRKLLDDETLAVSEMACEHPASCYISDVENMPEGFCPRSVNLKVPRAVTSDHIRLLEEAISEMEGVHLYLWCFDDGLGKYMFAPRLANAISQSRTLKHLSFYSLGELHEDACRLLIQGVAKNHSLETLFVDTTVNDHIARVCADVLSLESEEQSRSLICLSLKGPGVKKDDIEALLGMEKSRCGRGLPWIDIKLIDAPSCSPQIKEKIACYKQCMVSDRVVWSEMRHREPPLAILELLAARPRFPAFLDLTDAEIDDDAAILIAGVLRQERIRSASPDGGVTVVLVNNRAIGRRGVSALSEALRANPSLKISLGCPGVVLPEDEVIKFCDTLVEAQTPTRLPEITFANFKISLNGSRLAVGESAVQASTVSKLLELVSYINSWVPRGLKRVKMPGGFNETTFFDAVLNVHALESVEIVWNSAQCERIGTLAEKLGSLPSLRAVSFSLAGPAVDETTRRTTFHNLCQAFEASSFGPDVSNFSISFGLPEGEERSMLERARKGRVMRRMLANSANVPPALQPLLLENGSGNAGRLICQFLYG